MVYKVYLSYEKAVEDFISELSTLLLTHHVDGIVHLLGVGISRQPEGDASVPQRCVLMLQYAGTPLNEYLSTGPPGGPLSHRNRGAVEPAALLYYILPAVVQLLRTQHHLQNSMGRLGIEAGNIDIKPENVCMDLESKHGEHVFLKATLIDVEGIM